jgi:integrase
MAAKGKAAAKRKRQYGSGSVFRRGDGRWRIRWYEGGRRRNAGGFTSREQAQQALQKILGDVAAGRVGLPVATGPLPTLAKLAEDWLKRREKTHRSTRTDRYRWANHLRERVGHLQPNELDAAAIRRIVEEMLATGFSSTTARHAVRLLSTFYTDLVERGLAVANPVKALPRATRRLIRPAHDPKTTPFLEKLADVRRVFLALDEPLNVAFALGAFAGLRTGEVLGLRWAHVDLQARRIHVRESIGGPLKDDESRVVPILDSLLPVLSAWKLRAADAQGRVVPSVYPKCDHVDTHTPGRYLRAALDTCKIPKVPSPTAQDPAAVRHLTWYECTRHTFASHWVLGGGSIEMLKEILGHSTVLVTERYAHLKPELFESKILGALSVDLTPGRRAAVKIGRNLGASQASGGTRTA